MMESSSKNLGISLEPINNKQEDKPGLKDQRNDSKGEHSVMTV